MKTITVLFVDDESDLREVTIKRLETELPFSFIEASNPMEALDLFHKNKSKIKYVIVDYFMPGDNGLEFCKVVKDSSPNTRVIIFTGNTEIRNIVKKDGKALIDYIHFKTDSIDDLVNYFKMGELR